MNNNSEKNQQNCQICCEKFTTKRRHSIKCIHCNNSVCLQCFRTYLLSDDAEQVCMCCKENVSTEFIYLHTPKKFQQDFITKLTTLEIIQEKALLIATEERMDLINRLDLLKSRVHYMNKHLYFFKQDNEIRRLFDAAEKECEELETLLKQKKNDVDEKLISSFICPVVNCDGIVTRGKCSYCKNLICINCHTLKEPAADNPPADNPPVDNPPGGALRAQPQHQCDPNVLATMNLLKKDTKACPKCKIPIHKIDGCDQMFCIKCKTAFSWKTGKIETGIVHNPHYFEWMRTRSDAPLPRQLGDDPCNVEFDLAFEELFTGKALSKSSITVANKKYSHLLSSNFIPRAIREVRAIVPRLMENVHNAEMINREKEDFRKKYIMKKKKLQYDEEDEDAKFKTNEDKAEDKARLERNWFQQIKLMFKQREMKKDLIKLLEIFENCMKDSIVLAFRTGDYKTMYDTIFSILSYIQTQLKENQKRYGVANKTSLSIEQGFCCKLIHW